MNTLDLLYQNSPMEQYNIYNVMPFNVPQFGEINNVVFVLILSLIQSLSLFWVGVSREEIKLNSWSVISEIMYHTNLRIVSTYIGSNNRIYFPLLYTIFYIILFSNVLGQVPYSTTSTAEIVITLTISSTMLQGILIIGYQTLNTKLFAVLLPAGSPIPLIFLMVQLELLAYVTKILSLGQRQAINMLVGHILCKVLVGFIWQGVVSASKAGVLTLIVSFIPLLLLSVFLALEILIAYLQAYIFVFILCLTFKDIVQL